MDSELDMMFMVLTKFTQAFLWHGTCEHGGYTRLGVTSMMRVPTLEAWCQTFLGGLRSTFMKNSLS